MSLQVLLCFYTLIEIIVGILLLKGSTFFLQPNSDGLDPPQKKSTALGTRLFRSPQRCVVEQTCKPLSDRGNQEPYWSHVQANRKLDRPAMLCRTTVCSDRRLLICIICFVTPIGDNPYKVTLTELQCFDNIFYGLSPMSVYLQHPPCASACASLQWKIGNVGIPTPYL